jgi:hypothetical protein
MKFLVIGAGWYGCHFAHKLISYGHTVDIVDKTNGFFNGSSSKNQNRLHLGFHYPRSPDTIKECVNGYNTFNNIYAHLLQYFDKNLYMISSIKSNTNITTYESIFKSYDISYNIYTSVPPLKIQHVEHPIIKVDEQYINHNKAKKYFEDLLQKYMIYIEDNTLWSSINNIVKYIGKDYDYIINCTFNHLEPIDFDSYELFLSLLYKIDTPDIFAYTIMDGPFFSIYPYDIENKIYTVTSVNNGVLYKGKILDACIADDIILIKKEQIEAQIKEYIPTWNESATYAGHFTSWKTKHDYATDDRSLRFKKEENRISFYGGKITGIFEAEKVLDDILKGNIK